MNEPGIVQDTGLRRAEAVATRLDKPMGIPGVIFLRKVVVISQEIIDRAYQLTQQDQHQPRTHALLELFRAL